MIDIHRRTTAFFLLVCLGHVLLISYQVQSKAGVSTLELAASGATSGVQRGAAGLADAVHSLWGRYIALHGVVAENAALREQVVTLQGQLQAQQAMAEQAHALERALNLRASVAPRTLAARVIGGDPAPGAFIVTIDRGAADGVRANLGVLAPGGVVGRVIGEPTASTARVQLLIGRLAGAGARLERVQADGTVVGGGDDPPLQMQYVSNSFELQAGDRVVTSGQDGIFPPGFQIGTVVSFVRGNGTYRSIGVRPSVNFANLDVVLVLLDAPSPAAAPGEKK